MLRLSKSVIGQAEKEAVLQVLDKEYLGMGGAVKRFEEDLSQFLGRSTVCVSTGTGALQLAVQAAGLGKEDEILVQSMTYLASFQAITATGAKPIPCEIYEDTFTIDLADAEKRLTSRTKAIMPVHYAGGVGNLNEIYQFAQKYGLRVIEDAAHAFGTIYQNQVVGSMGDIVCFSFDGIKNITSGEGGAIISNDAEIIRKVSDARLLGVQKDTEKRYAGERSWEFDVSEQGWRYHMSNIMAAIGYTQLRRFPQFKEKRQALAKLYQSLLQNHEKITLLNHDYQQIVPHIFVIRVPSQIRDSLKAKLDAKGIQTGLHYKPNHLLSFFNTSRFVLSKTEQIFREIITLPIHPDLTEMEVHFICNTLKDEL